MKTALLVLALVLMSCRDESGSHVERIAALQAASTRLDGDLAQTEHQIASLSETWTRLTSGYSKLAESYQTTRRAYEEARASTTVASAKLEFTAKSWQTAQFRWELYREVVLLAVRFDRAASASTASECASVSTAAFRKSLIARGVDLTGKDIDHIVPKALGGADATANYQVLDASLNRSLGKTWDLEKCLMAGRRRCVEAVAVSSRCGSYRGGGFW